ncbi:hypothetical protein T4A_12886 [Trichinella pseudospiralis]|uniref:Uncharacterized protein n=1 Tax=Trichinella pseudospiralis TaxID=6337 RepID=A0A0V1DV11_TRIPS|nr:hypothetical protein T4A_12886 [Trichinella pseudospiralis]
MRIAQQLREMFLNACLQHTDKSTEATFRALSNGSLTNLLQSAPLISSTNTELARIIKGEDCFPNMQINSPPCVSDLIRISFDSENLIKNKKGTRSEKMLVQGNGIFDYYDFEMRIKIRRRRSTGFVEQLDRVLFLHNAHQPFLMILIRYEVKSCINTDMKSNATAGDKNNPEDEYYKVQKNV